MIDTLAVCLPLMLSPGPANLVSLALGARFGLARTAPFLLGVLVVYTLVALALGAFAVRLAGAAPGVATAIQLTGGAFIAYLGVAMLRRPATGPNETVTGPTEANAPRFLSGVLLQLLNPKYPAVVLAVFAHKADAPAAVTAGVLATAGAAGLMAYATAGSLVGSVITSDRGSRWLNTGFGVALVLLGVSMALRAMWPADASH